MEFMQQLKQFTVHIAIFAFGVWFVGTYLRKKYKKKKRRPS